MSEGSHGTARVLKYAAVGLLVGIVGVAISVALGLSEGGSEWIYIPIAAAVGAVWGERIRRRRKGAR